MSGINRFFTFWLSADRKYQSIKNDKEKRKKSVSLGVQSIVQSILCGALVVLLLLGFVPCYHYFFGDEGGRIFALVGMILCAIMALLFFIQGVIGGLIYMVYQFKLNKRSVRWLALLVWILVIIAVVFFLIWTFTRL